MSDLIVTPASDLALVNDVPQLMQLIRPQWQAKGLIERVRRLLPVDPSSACQRLLNAAIQDLREKIKMAGIDIAKDAAQANSLPPVNRPDDVDNYSVAKIIELSWRMGLLSRPDYRRMARAYDIRRDLEHEDSEYEADFADVISIFKVCIEAVLSKDPVIPIKISEIKEVIEVAGPAVADERLVDDFEGAPDTRQLELLKYLLSEALNEKESDLVRANAFSVLGTLSAKSRDAVIVDLARHMQDKVGRRGLTELEVRVAQQSGAFPYLRKAQKRAFFIGLANELDAIPYGWRSNASHGAILRSISDVGGLSAVTPDELKAYVKWMTLCYIGEPGGYGAGIRRPVFYSNSAAHLIKELFEAAPENVRPILEGLAKDKDVKAARARGKDISRRYDDLLDLVESTD